jgi:uncharacterized repeat protein (TIGR02543 family)
MTKITKVLLLMLLSVLLIFSAAACSSGSGEITAIELTGDYRNVYVVGEDLDLNGMNLVVTKSDGTKQTVRVADIRDEVKFLGVDTDRVANKALITVEYKKQRTTFTIDVVQQDADENKVNVVFDLNIPSLTAQQRIYENRKVLQLARIDAPASAPVRQHYVQEATLYAFDGWYKDAALTNPWNFMVDQVVLTADNTDRTVYIYAKWTPYCTVTFIKVDANGTESFIASKLVKKGDSLSDYPSIPIAAGEEKYTFEWDFSSNFITQDTTIRTKIPVLKTYSVVFCDFINNVSQELYRINDVPYGTNLLDPATVLTGTQSSVHTLADIAALSPNNKEHYVFTGEWEYKNNVYSVSNPGANNPLTNVRQDMQLYAHYRIETFTATFNINYAGGTNPPSQTVNYNTPIVNVSVSREGYDFDGWYKEPECLRPWNFNTEKLTGDRILYAKWTKLYTIRFYALFYGDSVGQSDREPAMDAGSVDRYTTSGIWTDTNGRDLSAFSLGETQQYVPGGYCYNYLVGPEGNAYTRISITTLTVRSGETARNLPSVSSSNVALTGYTARWSSTSFSNITSDREIYAIYTIMTFNIRFVDGATQIGATQIVPYKGAAVAPDDPSDSNMEQKAAFEDYLSTSRKGYNFVGWDSQDYLYVTENKTVSAVFTPKTYRVTIETVPGSLEIREAPYDTTLLLVTPVRQGYDFDGWYTTPDYLPESVWSSSDKVFGNLSIYAKWVEIFTVTFTDDNTVAPLVLATRTVRKGATLTNIPAVPEIVGKNGEWREDGAIPNFVNIQRNMVISASYTDKTFTVTFKNGNYDTYYLLANVLYNSKIIPPSSPADPSQREPDDGTPAVGYTFEGWTVGGVSGYVNFASYVIRQDTTFIADYSRRTFQVLFVDSDYDQTGTVLAVRTIVYEAQAYPPANPSKEGMDFIGWSCDKNSLLPTPNDYKSIVGDTIVYALYRIKTYRVTFKSLEDNQVWATINVDHGSYATYPSSSPTPSYTGYTFVRWDFNFSTPITSNKTIYAVFSINSYTITYNTNGGSPIDPYVGVYNTYPVQPQEPYYEGMAFLGWYTDEMLNTLYRFDQPLTQDITLYAKWSPYVSGFGGITFSLNSQQTGYTVVSVNPDAIAVKIDNFYQNKPVLSIGSGAFADNHRLQIVVLPNTLISIGANAFSGCVNLRKADIPETVTTIGDNAFSGCTALKTVTFPENAQLRSIGAYAFSGASALTGLLLPQTLTTIGAGAFYNCALLYDLEVPRSVSSIGANAFENCVGLKYAKFERTSPCALGASAFSGLSGSFRIYVPDVLAYTTGVSAAWQSLASKICPSSQIASDWYYEILKTGAHAGKLRLLHYLGSDTVLTVPESLNIAGVVRQVYSFGDNLFDGKVTVFKMNSDMPLSSATFGSAAGLVRLEMSIIDSNGQQRELLNSNMTIIRTAYETIGTLSEFSVSAIRSLKSLFGNVMPPANLKKVIILPDLSTLPAEMFYNCHSIQEVFIPATITSIGDRAFYSCFDLRQVSFEPGSTLAHIGSGAFENCVGLEYIALPATVTQIDSNAFKSTPFVENSEEDYVVLGDGILYKYNADAKIVILPKEIKKINEYAFYGASLRSFMFETGSELTSVGPYAFAECVNLEHAAFPLAMSQLGEGAFYNDKKLSKVVFFYVGTGGASISIANTTDVFRNTMSSLEVYVPSSEKENYIQENNNWEVIVASQLGLSSWSGLRGAGLSYYGDWLFDYNSVLGTTLIQYYGDSEDIVVPDFLDSGTGQISPVIKLNNYVFPRDTRTISIDASLMADPKVFGGLSSLTEITLRNVTPDMPSYNPDPLHPDPNHYVHEYLYGMLSVNKSLAVVNVGGQVSIRNLLGALPPSTLTTVNIFEEETVLAAEMFKDCVNIVNINLPSTITYVGERAFANSGWERNYNGDFVIILRDLDGRGLLVGYKGNAQYVVLPSDVREINRKLFEGNTSIEILELADVSVIHDEAFKNATRLNKIFMTGDAPEFGSGVFSGLMSGALLYVDADKVGFYHPSATAGVTVCPNNLIASDGYLIEEITPETAKLVQSLRSGGAAEMPSKIGNHYIVSIGANAFYSTATSLTFYSNVTNQPGSPAFSAPVTLDANAFRNLKSLASVTIYNTGTVLFNRQYLYELLTSNPSLNKLSYNGDCTLVYLLNGQMPPASLKTIEILSGSEAIVDNLLDDCPNIKNIILPSTLKTVGYYAFEETAWYAAQSSFVIIVNGYLYKYKGTESNVTIPASVRTVGVRAFSQRTAGGEWQGNLYMKSVKFAGGSVAGAILSEAFYKCALLVKFDAPASLSYIASDAFRESGISQVGDALITTGDKGDILIKYTGSEADYTLPAGITVINSGAFRQNTAIQNLIIPSGSLLVSIGSDAFRDCTNLEMIWMDSKASNDNKVRTIFPLQFIDSIGENAFAGTPWYSGLGSYLFGNKKLLLVHTGAESLMLSDNDIPSGFELNMISGAAFGSCDVRSLYIDMTSVPTLMPGALDSLADVYVPAEMYNMYTTQWSAYASRLHAARVSDGTFVNPEGTLIYVNPASDTIFFTDRSGLTFLPASPFTDARNNLTMVFTQTAPPAKESGSLNKVSDIYVPLQALATYQSLWSDYAGNLHGYAVNNGFYIVNNVLYQYLGSSAWVEVPSGVTAIAGYAFSLGTNIEYLHFPSSVVSVAKHAHYGLQNAVVAAAGTVVNMDEHFADNVLALHMSVPYADASELAMSGGTVIRYLGKVKNYSLPSSVTGIAAQAFAGHKELFRLEIPTTVVSIQKDAFAGCENAVLLVAAENVPAGFAADWNAGAFFTYVNYSIITYENSKYIVVNGNATLLEAAAGLTSISLSYAGGYKIAGIAANAFSQSPAIKKIYLSSDVVNVNSKSFDGCSGAVVYLSGEAVPSGFLSGWTADILEYFTNYGKVFVSGGYRYVINGSAAILLAYEGTQTALTVPGSVAYLGNNYMVTTIAAYAFYNNTSIASVTFPTQMNRIGAYAFYGCQNLAAVVWSNNINYIGTGAFAGTPWLASRTGWVSSGSKGYLYAGSSNIVFVPSGMTSIISGALSSGDIRYAVFTAAVPVSIGASLFDGLEKVLVPAAYLSAYRTAAVWSDYASKIDSYTEYAGALYYHGALLSYIGGGDNFEVPVSVGGYAVTEIMDGAFAGHSDLKTLWIGQGIAVIGKNVFAGCSRLFVQVYYETYHAQGAGCFDGVYSLYAYRSIFEENGVRYGTQENGTDLMILNFLAGSEKTEVPATVCGGIPAAIAPWAYLDSSAVKILLPNLPIAIDAHAFDGAQNLVLIAYTDLLNKEALDMVGEVYEASHIRTYGDFEIYVNGGQGIYMGYNGTDSYAEIYGVISGITITGIAGYALLNSGLKTVMVEGTIPAGNISDAAFMKTGADTVVYYLGDANLSEYAWASGIFEAHTRSQEYTYEGYTYTLYKDGVLIVKYTCDAAEEVFLTIPERLPVGVLQLEVKGIASGAFDSFTVLKQNIVIPSSVVFIGKNAFIGAESHEMNVHLWCPDNAGFVAGWNRYFSDTFFRTEGDTVDLYGIVYLADGDHAAVIGYSGISNVKVIEKTVMINGIARSVTKIASYAFENIDDYAHIYIPNSITTVRNRIIYQSDHATFSLALATVPSSWSLNGNIILSSAKINYNNLILLRENGVLNFIRYEGKDASVHIPAQIVSGGITYDVRGIASYAFSGSDNIYRLYLPASVNTAAENAFYNCGKILLYTEDNQAQASAWLHNPADFKGVYYDSGSLTAHDGFLYQLDGNEACLVECLSSDSEVEIPYNFSIGPNDYTVRTIGIYAFAFRTDITKIIINDSIVSAGPDAFLGTSNAVLDLMMNTMPDWGEGWQGDVISVNINASRVCSIGGFTYLLSTTEAMVTGYEDIYAVSLTIPSVITYYSNNYTVTKIAEYAFCNFMNLGSVRLEEGSRISEIGAYAFYNCINMYEFGFTDQITRIGEKAFTSTLWYQNKIADGMVYGGSPDTLRLYTGMEEAVVLTNSSGVNAILGGAFGSNSSVRYLVFLNGAMPQAHPHAFDTIEKILVPANLVDSYKAEWDFAKDRIEAVTESNGMLFYQNVLLAIVDAQASSLEIPAFAGNYAINTIAAYADKTGLTAARELRIPATITHIGDNSFPTSVIYYSVAARSAGYGSITALAQYYNAGSIFEENGSRFILAGGKATLVKYTGSHAEYTVPLSVSCGGMSYPVTAIGAYSFTGESTLGLRSVFVPSAVSIHAMAFHNARSVPSFIIYSALPQGNYAWAQNWEMPVYFGVSEVYSQASLRYILCDGEIIITQYFGGAEQTSIVIPQTIIIGTSGYPVTAIGNYAFAGKASLASIAIPSSIRYIGKNAFYGTYWLEHAERFIIDNHRLLLYNGTGEIVTLDESLGIREIVGGAFLSSNASRVIITGETPVIALCEGAFEGVDMITVPDIALDIYTQYLWSDYSEIIVGSEYVWGDFGFSFGTDNKVTVTHYYGGSGIVAVPGSVTIGNVTYQVTALAAGLFAGRTDIIQIYLPASIAEIGAATFEGCINARLYLASGPRAWYAGWDQDLIAVIYNYIG